MDPAVLMEVAELSKASGAKVQVMSDAKVVFVDFALTLEPPGWTECVWGQGCVAEAACTHAVLSDCQPDDIYTLS